MPEHQDPFQLRAAGHARRGPAASLQFVRKISGFTHPSKANERPFKAAVKEIAKISNALLHSLETNAPPKNRDEEAAKAKARAVVRFGT